ncbi:hypothetical protein ACJDU8_21170 [Clostridium sp. WILCCON 0269]|uniref:Conjugal transfer protein n=1 Tax=Candidatus Clostridium eludens TaxID=3381663 RepID=A0ABW8SS77_9CLOT
MRVDKEDVKEALIEILDESGEQREGKKFVFPRNVEASYNLIPGLTLMDVFKYVTIPVIVGLLIFAVPPYDIVALWIIKLMIALPIVAFGFVAAIGRPVRYRNNIRFIEHMRDKLSFKSRQKLYYLRPRENKEVLK